MPSSDPCRDIAETNINKVSTVQGGKTAHQNITLISELANFSASATVNNLLISRQSIVYVSKQSITRKK